MLKNKPTLVIIRPNLYQQTIKNKTTAKYLILKPNQITFTDENNIDYKAGIISRAGKSTGKYSNCYNIKYYAPSNASGTQTWIDLSKVKNLLIIPERAVSSSPNNHHTSNNIFSDQYVNHNSQRKEANVVENSLIDEIYVNQHLCFQSAKERN